MTPTTPEQRPVPLITPLLNTLEERAANIRNETLVLIPFALVMLAIGASLGFWMAGTFESPRFPDASRELLSFFAWGDGFFQNFGTEMVGAVITILLLEVTLARRREHEAEAREKERLILQMGSPDNGFAVEAARQLRARGWLTDGSLTNISLRSANLSGADLAWANLSHAVCDGANLSGAELFDANLRDAWLGKVNLTGAHLHDSQLANARLIHASLLGASHISIDALREAASLEGAVLPDGTHLPGRVVPRFGSPLGEIPDWRTPFEAWCETVETDENGFIVPAPLDEEEDVLGDHAPPAEE